MYKNSQTKSKYNWNGYERDARTSSVVIERFLMELKGEFNWVWIAGVLLLGFQPQRNSGR